MNKFLERTVTVLLFVALAYLGLCLLFFIMLQGSGHKVPSKTNVSIGLHAVGALIVFLLCWLILRIIKRKA